MAAVRQRRQQKMAACVHCRQMKLKCDGNEKFPAPCSRCSSSGLNCHVDPLFKRTAKRERLNAVERQLREIKEKLHAPGAISPPETKQNPVLITPTTTTSPESVDPSVFQHEIIHIRNTMMPRSLNGVELQPDLVADLVEEFYARYHGQFPILPEVPSSLLISDNQGFLFWTVMMVAMRRRSDCLENYLLLADGIRLLASQLISRPGTSSLQDIQALLILCCWPPPFGPAMDDTSWTYLSLATSNALRLGLHRPKHIYDFEHHNKFDDTALLQRRLAWIGCFIVNYCVSTYMGIPAMVQPEQSILEAATSQPSWLPDTLFFQLQIARYGIQLCNTLGNSDLTASGLLPNSAPYLRTYEAELRLLEMQHSKRWPKQDFVNFLGCKLIIYGFGVTASNLPDDSGDGQGYSGHTSRLDAQHWAEQAFLASSVIVQSACSMKDTMMYSTVYVQRWVANAVGYLLRLIIYPQSQQHDEVAIRNGINQGWELLKTCSIKENDHMSRVCAIISYLSGESMKKDPLQQHVVARTQSRMGANMFSDMVNIARGRWSQHLRDKRPHDCTGAAVEEQQNEVHISLELDDLFSSQFTDWDSFLQDI
ncbi:hypothetical protein EJ04DRAFT_448539 [Polyplosphaeria fusca]|uniref:Zn(2)-C6 fungal-type domain-containing protein n=1 Tax=Polyplosphaeria fusca TaxID=682080 RepID=A0A9P4QK65_9PLEO|nr:hypothetical protein EJ04DRAFT_448539 [Polyplosphaeria fusca]